MVVVVKSLKDVSKAKKAIAERQPEKKFDAYKFCGALKVTEDPQIIQQRLRDEWK
jgi:putative IMPACT (imprinted ancient) family translation regulator